MTHSRRRIEILIVSHDRAALATVKAWLRTAGYHVVACSSFLSARKFLTRRVPAAVITDIRLGPFNGLQLVYLAKEQRPDVVVAVIADEEDPVLRSEAQRAGAAFLVKPVTEEAVLATVRTLHA